MFKSLRERLVLSHVLVVLLSLLLGFLVLVVAIRPVLLRLTYTTLADKALPTSRFINELWRTGATLPNLRDLIVQQSEEQQVRIVLIDPTGEVVLDTSGSLEGQRLTELVGSPLSGDPRYISGSFRSSSGENLLYVAIPAPVIRAPTPQPLVILLATPARGIWGFLGQLLSGFAWAGFVALIVGAGLALFITNSLSAPIKRIAGAAKAISAGDYDQRLDIGFPSEMHEVATSFNQMSSEVKQSRQTMRDFVANVSHELKTPLTSVRGFAEAILDGTTQDTAGQQHAAEVIRDEAMRMSRLVEQLLDLSKIESGQVELGQTPVRVGEVLKASCEKLGRTAQEMGIELFCETSPLPVVRGDSDRLAQVFTNLLDNALKHTPAAGKVTASARSVTEGVGDEKSRWIEVAVTDTGSGIPADELDRVFERFYQLDKSRSGDSRGTGLGLAISKSIVDAHGGRIWAESGEGNGSRFVVRLPVEE